jgi:hypothetical protein
VAFKPPVRCGVKPHEVVLARRFTSKPLWTYIEFSTEHRLADARGTPTCTPSSASWPATSSGRAGQVPLYIRRIIDGVAMRLDGGTGGWGPILKLR